LARLLVLARLFVLLRARRSSRSNSYIGHRIIFRNSAWKYFRTMLKLGH
jgi:hypothetical protein